MDSYELKSIIKNIELSINYRCNHILTLVDRNSYSDSFGCFDRAFWQYKIKDFASGMSQEAIYPLALALQNDFFKNISKSSKVDIINLISGAAKFSLDSQHSNGSVDDYFPFEQAAGATAFSAFSLINTLEMGLINFSKKYEKKFKNRIFWLAKHKESGRLSNHEALITLVIAKSARFFNDKHLFELSYKRCLRLLSWQSKEGWFEEYGGFDIGYETLTFSCLLEISKILPDLKDKLSKVISNNANLILEFAEPDYCIGGELYSRSTWNFFGHGLLTYALEKDHGLLIKVLKILRSRFIDYPIYVQDDYIIQHHLWSDLLTFTKLKEIDPLILQEDKINLSYSKDVKVEKLYKESGHIWVRSGDIVVHISLKLGGVFRVYKKEKFKFQETQNAIQFSGMTFMANSFNNNISWEWIAKNKLKVKGLLTNYKKAKMNTIKLIILRIMMVTFGRYFSDTIRYLMQKILINTKFDKFKPFTRTFIFLEDSIEVEDNYRLNKNEVRSSNVIITSFSAFRHVVMSKVFHPYFIQNEPPLNIDITKYKTNIIVKRKW